MLQNLLQLRRAAGSERDFFDRIQVVTFGLSTESIELCYHWASQDGGIVKYYGQAVNTWNPNSKLTSDYVHARRYARNALSRVMTENRKWDGLGLRYHREEAYSRKDQSNYTPAKPIRSDG
jgi:hypothetical protein